MTDTTAALSPATEARRHWMAVLARAPRETLESSWAALPAPPTYTYLRTPEIGSTLVRGRAGGTGKRFNLGEMTLTRCAVHLDTGATGFAWVAGRDRRHAELAAVFDALLQDDAHHQTLTASLIAPLAAAQAAVKVARSREAAATKVEFFTMVRGEDE